MRFPGKTAIVSFLFFFLLSATVSAFASPLFPSDPRYATGTTPVQFAAGDLDGDGLLDLAVVNAGTNDLSVFSGKGDGTFGVAIAYPLDFEPRTIALGDFNNDGYPDAVIPCYDYCSHGLYLLLNQGDGSFGSATPVPGIANGDEAAAADFNGDGSMDLAVSHLVGGKHTYSVMLGDGSGALSLANSYELSGNASSMISGDLNGDGQPDIAFVVGRKNKLVVALNAGGGSLQPPIMQNTESNPGAVAQGFFDDDLLPDLAVVHTGGSQPGVTIFIGQGEGQFAPSSTYRANNGYSVAIGDLDGDGRVDLAVPNFNHNELTVLHGNGDGTFLPTPRYLPGGRGPVSIRIADLNGDGLNDLMTLNQLSNDVSVWPGRGASDLGLPRIYSTGYAPTDIQLGDFNGDGMVEAILPTWAGYSIVRGTSPTDFSLNTNYGLAGADDVSGLAAADFNRDGYSDFALLNATKNRIEIRLGSAGGFQKSPTQVTLDGTLSDIAIGDFNGDGELDIAAANRGGNDPFIVLPGVGDGTFSAQHTYSLDASPMSLAPGDYNGDGLEDMAITYVDSNRITLLLSTDMGNFADIRTFAADGVPSGIVSADFNGDRIADLAIAVKSTNKVYVYAGSSDGSLSLTADIGLEGGLSNLAAGDFDGDGILDLAVTASSTSKVYVLQGLGNGAFTGIQSYATGIFPIAAAAHDFNEDGKSDLLIAGKNNGDVTLLLSLPPMGRIELDSPAYMTGKDEGSVTIQVKRTGGEIGVASIAYHTEDGSAIAGTDYTGVSGTLVFADGQTTGSISIPILDNDQYGSDKSFTITLSRPSGGAVLGPLRSATVTLTSSVLPVQGAYEAKSEAADAAPVAGEETSVTLTVYRSDGSRDTSFNGSYDVTLSGYSTAPDGTRGSFMGQPLQEGGYSRALTFVDGEASATLALNRAGLQEIQFELEQVAYPTSIALLDIKAAAVQELRISRQPAGPGSAGGGRLGVQPQVTVVDRFGNPIAGLTIQASREEDGNSWTLTGSSAVTGENGRAEFVDLAARNTAGRDLTGVRIRFAETASLLSVSSDGITLLRSRSDPGNPAAPAPSEQTSPATEQTNPAAPGDTAIPADPDDSGKPEEESEGAPERPPFNDIAGHWAYAFIAELYADGIIKGYPDGTFRPNANMTRAEFTTILVNALKPPQASGTPFFKDTAGHWAAEAIAEAQASGIVKGYADQTFRPDEYLTREQMIAMAVRAFRPEDESGGENRTFADSAEISAWAEESIQTAVRLRWIAGYAADLLMPQQLAKRAEAAKIISVIRKSRTP
ncbi:FG-GAP-like repeat-containing protein [Cohnella cellulosilytica]|uniref:FG-GAP-like repeat-containing protein n=1 Tax=Cohnella cellulosilytica TaxID=986710 RepID=A0ABW2FD92_9BACL